MKPIDPDARYNVLVTAPGGSAPFETWKARPSEDWQVIHATDPTGVEHGFGLDGIEVATSPPRFMVSGLVLRPARSVLDVAWALARDRGAEVGHRARAARLLVAEHDPDGWPTEPELPEFLVDEIEREDSPVSWRDDLIGLVMKANFRDPCLWPRLERALWREVVARLADEDHPYRAQILWTAIRRWACFVPVERLVAVRSLLAPERATSTRQVTLQVLGDRFAHERPSGNAWTAALIPDVVAATEIALAGPPNAGEAARAAALVGVASDQSVEYRAEIAYEVVAHCGVRALLHAGVPEAEGLLRRCRNPGMVERMFRSEVEGREAALARPETEPGTGPPAGT
jgi:hypothetical protein